MRIRDGDSSDPGSKKVGSGMFIPDPGSVTLQLVNKFRILHSVDCRAGGIKKGLTCSVALTLALKDVGVQRRRGADICVPVTQAPTTHADLLDGVVIAPREKKRRHYT
jgi:hypothetical protein